MSRGGDVLIGVAGRPDLGPLLEPLEVRGQTVLYQKPAVVLALDDDVKVVVERDGNVHQHLERPRADRNEVAEEPGAEARTRAEEIGEGGGDERAQDRRLAAGDGPVKLG